MHEPVKPKKKALAALLVTLYLDLVGFSILFPIYGEMMTWYGASDTTLLPAWKSFMADVFGVSDQTRLAAFFGATLGGLYAGLQFFVAPYWGRKSDRIGRRPILILTVTANLLSSVLWVFSASFAWLLLARVISGVATANISVASAGVADLSTRENRTRAMGLMGAVIGLGFLTGPGLGALAAMLPDLGAPDARGLALHPFSGPALVAVALNAINLLLVLTRLPETRVEGTEVVRADVRPFALFRADLGPAIARAAMASFVFVIVFSAFESTIVFLALQLFGWGAGSVGPYMVAIGLASALVQGGLVRRLAPRFGELPLARAGLCLFLPGLLLLAALERFTSPVAFYAGGLLLALGMGLFTPTMSSIVSLAAPPGGQGLAMGRFRSAGSLGRAIGPLLAGVLYFRFGPSMPFLVGAVLLAIPMALVWSLRAPRTA